MNSILPHWIDQQVEEVLKKKKFGNNLTEDENIIELSDEFQNLFKSNIYDIGPSRFLSLLKKR